MRSGGDAATRGCRGRHRHRALRRTPPEGACMMRGTRCRSRPRLVLRRLGAVLLCILCAGCSTGGTTAIATEGGQ
ncbi:MAG: hypothetical protein ACK559_38255, partial [bacterium]